MNALVRPSTLSAGRLFFALLALLLAGGCSTRTRDSDPLRPIELHARQLPGAADGAALRDAIEKRAQELVAEGVDPRAARAMAAAEYSGDIVGRVPRMPRKRD